MLITLGTDLLYIPRLERGAQKNGRPYFEKMLTVTEIDNCLLKLPGLDLNHFKILTKMAARIAVKEAVSKALGTGLNGLGWGQGISWHDVEVISPEKQAPYIALTGQAKEIADEKGITQWQVSWSHDGDYVSATVIGYAA